MAVFSYLIAVGSNLGDRRALVKQAMDLLVERGVRVESVSELVETAPIGVADRIFLNGAFTCSAEITPDDFMRLLLDVEERLGRVRDVRWGNRNIDLDILLIRNDAGQSIEHNSQLLTVPHPRMPERDFMLRPAAAVAGHWLLPHSDQNLRALCVSRGWRPTWSNLKGDIKLWQALKGDVFSATTSRLWWPVLVLVLVFRLWVASEIPFGNDEAYYWDWGRAPQASYFDHPPFVSWISMVSRLLVFSWTEGPLQGRFLIPFLHLLTTLMFGALAVRLTRRVLTNLESRSVLIVSQLVPAFSLGGIMLMPDASLILFMTAAVWLVIGIARRDYLPWWTGIVLGILLGGAGLSKYHAAVMAAGLLGWLLWRRSRRLAGEWSFWICLLVTGLVVVSPVIWWNVVNDWASIRFQGSRGLAGGSLDFVPALRTLAGEMIFLGPIILIGFWSSYRRRREWWHPDDSVIVWTAVPLLILLKIFSLTSQALPHWTMPSIWILGVFAVPAIASSRRLRWTGRIYGIILCFILPVFLSLNETRRAILRWTGDRPAALGELTLWPSAVRDRNFMNFVKDETWIAMSLSGHKLTDRPCARGLVYAAPRWFTVAQVAANFPKHPMVETLDPDHLSYYHYRSVGAKSGCPVLIISEKAHWREQGWAGIDIIESEEFLIEGHRDRPVILGRGWYNESASDE
ncbi:MAG: 2-amino-4-hydroxy-6-hydroxymethyldihydropteridine diphosphokinase [bacterium]